MSSQPAPKKDELETARKRIESITMRMMDAEIPLDVVGVDLPYNEEIGLVDAAQRLGAIDLQLLLMGRKK